MGQRIKVQTKFDCTTTGVTGHFRHGDTVTWHKQRNQQRNYETLTQIIGLYTQPQNLTPAEYDAQSQTWTFVFEIEFEGVFRTGTDELGILKQTCRGTPMVTGLDESIDLGCQLDPDCNVWFEIE